MRLFGARIGIRVNDAAALPRLMARLPGGYRLERRPIVDSLFSLIHGGRDDRTNVRRFHMLWSEQRQESRTHDEEALLDAFESTLQARLMAVARGYDFVHAGAVGWRGRAIVLPGHSMAGKSTLVDALVRAGATYYSDEYAVFDRRGRVHAFSTPLRLRLPGGGFERRDLASAGDVSRSPLPLGLIVQTRYEPQARWQPRTLEPGERVLALLPHAARANRAPAVVMRVLARAANSAAGIATPRGDADRAAASILQFSEDGR